MKSTVTVMCACASGAERRWKNSSWHLAPCKSIVRDANQGRRRLVQTYLSANCQMLSAQLSSSRTGAKPETVRKVEAKNGSRREETESSASRPGQAAGQEGKARAGGSGSGAGLRQAGAPEGDQSRDRALARSLLQGSAAGADERVQSREPDGCSQAGEDRGEHGRG